MESIVPKTRKRRIFKKRRVIVEDENPNEGILTLNQLITILIPVVIALWLIWRFL